MTWTPDTYFDQPNTETLLQQHITYSMKDGKIVKETVTRRFFGDDYQDSFTTEVIVKL